MNRKIKNIALLCIFFCIIGTSFLVGINGYINSYSQYTIYSDAKKVPKAYTGLILGALAFQNGNLSDILEDRVLQGLYLYKNKKIKKFLLSGDHGTPGYDEVNNMKKFLLKRGVPSQDIFLDHAGFNTYNSIIRAQKIFQVKDVIIITQKYHLPRALYIATKTGMSAYGYIADRRSYIYIKNYKFREVFANIKAFFEVLLDASPTFLGSKIPITGDSKKSWDKNIQQ